MRRTRGCDRTPPRSWESIQTELDQLVADGVLETIVDPNGTVRYQRTEATDG